ncbi:DUF3182 family protein [Xylophilus sp.]|uniref:DUF3182 family protein n=1 Tax=Xylophilus sp. TaxID=2653893 RepID=UPI0013B8338B|nr:DUF3182 family protein [Xylophilus sp.]KAF1047401.1 MAG: hypothetical protein GAK38_01920 [Xylophilus sp.]
MPFSAALSPSPAGTLVVYLPRHDTPPHETGVHRALTERLAALAGQIFDGDHDAARHGGRPVYVVPAFTIESAAEAERPGIRDEGDLFGGVVPQAFVGSKLITHGLVRPDAAAPPHWQPDFAMQVRPSVLAGYSTFSREDARTAGRELLRAGPVRLKPACGRGGRGQTVVRDGAALDAALAAIGDDDFRDEGLVVEEDLADAETFSVGQIRTPRLTLSYHGTQRLTPDNDGRLVYGGSDLTVVRGGFDALIASGALAPELRTAVDQARRYDAAAGACFAGFYASRRNYDVVAGTDAQGRRRSGVLEQSWRIGGASGAEVAALAAFVEGGATGVVRASCVERFGRGGAPPPAGATLLYQGDDPEVGFVTKYAYLR